MELLRRFALSTAIPTLLLLLPDFALILFGLALKRFGGFTDEFWEGLEKLVFFALFPALLFISITRAQVVWSNTLPAVLVGFGATAIGAALAFAGGWLLKPESRVFASSVQIAFRFSSYVGLAIASRLTTIGQADALVQMAMLIAVVVPGVNVLAVYALARESRQPLFMQLVKNPIILATVLGAAWNVWMPPLPTWSAQFLDRLGGASLALGLMTVGAGMLATKALVRTTRRPVGWMGYVLTVKHIAMPLAAIGLAWLLGYSHEQTRVGILFAALPTAASAYVLTTRMGGDGPLVAEMITASTLLGMLLLPVWLVLV